MRTWLLLTLILTGMPYKSSASDYEQDTLQTTQGPLVMTFLGHGSLMLQFNNLVIQVDPVAQEADYTKFPKADIILVTHHHSDHFDPGVLNQVMKNGTQLLLTGKCIEHSEGFEHATVMKNGDERTVLGIPVAAVPAYNIVHMRSGNTPFHPKGEGNGYLLTLGDKRVYIAGDTENTPEMKALKNVDVTFLPMNLPYTMTPEMVADAVRAFKPKIVYPYHYGSTDTRLLVKLLQDSPETEVRVRSMK